MRHLRTVTSQRPYGVNIIVKMADCGSDVEFKNEKKLRVRRKQLAIDINYDFLTSFCRTMAVVTSHFAAITLTDFLAKARLLDRDGNLMYQFNCIMAEFINKSSERCVLLVFGLFR